MDDEVLLRSLSFAGQRCSVKCLIELAVFYFCAARSVFLAYICAYLSGSTAEIGCRYPPEV